MNKKERHYAKFAKLYKQGMRMKDISKKVGISVGRLSSAELYWQISYRKWHCRQ